MSILRSEHQVALQELFGLIQESIDHYEDAAEFVDDSAAKNIFQSIAAERQPLAGQVAQAIRATDDLPAAPNADKEAGQQLLQHLHSLLTGDQTRDVIEQRLKAEQALEDALATLRQTDTDASFQALLQKFDALIAQARQQLQQALSVH